MKRLLLIFAFLLAPQLFGQTGSITAVSIDTNGWDAYISISGFTDLGTVVMGLGTGNNPSTAKIVFTVTSLGFTTTGSATTITHTVYGTKAVRYPYPNAWASSTAYALNNTVSDGTNVQKVIACAGSCTSGGSAPSWNATLGGSTVDNPGSNQITWKNMGTLALLSTPASTTGPWDANVSVAGTMTIRVALSEFIYADDTPVTVTMASGFYTDNGPGGTGSASAAVTNYTVTNNSTLAYPKVVGRWAVVGYQDVTAAFPLEFAAFHRWARNSSEVAAVIFTCTDQHSHSNSVTVSQMTKSTLASFYGDQNTVLVYAATMPVTGFTGNDQLTCNAVSYPWFGDSGATLNTAVGADGSAQPSEKLGPIYDIYDAGSYRAAYVQVNTSTGSDTTCTGRVFNTQAAAQSDTGMASIRKAAGCIEAYNNTNYGRADVGNGFILLAAGNYTGYTGTASALGSNNVWLTIEPVSTASQSQVVFTGTGANADISTDYLTLVKMTGVTIGGSGSNYFRNLGGGTRESLWLHNDYISNTGSAPYYEYGGVMYATANKATAFGFPPYSTNKCAYGLIRGNACSFGLAGTLYAFIGNANCIPDFISAGNPGGEAVSDDAVVAYNTILGISSNTYTTIWSEVTATPTPMGEAVVQNVWEANISDGGPFGYAADSSTQSNNNWIFQHNTYAGAGSTFQNGRFNFAYNEFTTSAPTRFNWSIKYNNFAQTNIKTDTYSAGPPNPVRVGNWPADYGAGIVGNIRQSILFEGDFIGLGMLSTAQTPLYVYDATSAGAGGGNYMIKSGSASIGVGSGFLGTADEVLPYDLRGAPRICCTAGAYMYQQAGSVFSGASQIIGPSKID